MAHLGELPENSFRGMATVFNGVIDAYIPTMIHKGAFTKTLQESARGIKLLWQHDIEEPIGLPTFLGEVDTGLALQGKISLTGRGRDALQLMRDKVLDAVSIGFDPIKEEWQFDEHGTPTMRHIKELRLWEISLVTFGADPQARIMEVHGKTFPVIGRINTMAATPFGDLPLYERAAAWTASAAEGRVRDWANATEKPNAKYRRAFLWYDASAAEDFGSYKLPFADVTDGTLTAVPRGIFAAAGAVQGARGGVNIPDDDKAKVKTHLEKYYAKMRREFKDDTIVAPWDGNSMACIAYYETADALFLLGQKMVEGLSIDEVQDVLSCILKEGVVPETHTPVGIDVERVLLDAELEFAEMSVE